MNTTASSPGTSPRQLAAVAGTLYLVNIVLGAFALGVVPAMLAAPDAAAMLDNIRTHELLYRLGLAAHVVVAVTNVPLALLFYELFKAVNRRLALLDAFFILVATAVEAAGLINQFAPLVLLGSGSDTSAPAAAHLLALAYAPGGALSSVGYSLHTVFFGFDILIIAYLVLRSGFLPGAIGVLLAIDGLAYLIYSFASLLAPGFAAQLVPWIQLPALIGEGSLCLWLLVVGVDVERWKAWASAAIPTQRGPMEALEGGLS
jgi:hypothetical protein